MTVSAQKSNAERWRKLFLFFFTWIVLSLAYCIMNVPYIIDESVTMANVALLSGHNWSEYISTTGNYYIPVWTGVFEPALSVYCRSLSAL